MAHSNISIFVPHLGCPHQCSFCNQKHITGCSSIPRENDIDAAVKVALSSKNFRSEDAEIAFFGGSFTAIERSYMLELLTAAYKFVESGDVSGIRISTRPDCISEEILEILKKYGVTAIELGAQSMVDSVLLANNRGHLSHDVILASKLIKKHHFSLGLQMMTGLYMSTKELDTQTAREIIALQPDSVRIYPTITIKNTYLEKLYLKGDYEPMSLDSAVSQSAELEEMFTRANIKVIRIGLHSIEHDSYVAGPWHPAFRELCDSYRYKIKLENLLKENKSYNIYTAPNRVSKIIGHNRSNIKYFNDKNIKIKIIPDISIKSDFNVEEVN